MVLGFTRIQDFETDLLEKVSLRILILPLLRSDFFILAVDNVCHRQKGRRHTPITVDAETLLYNALHEKTKKEKETVQP